MYTNLLSIPHWFNRQEVFPRAQTPIYTTMKPNNVLLVGATLFAALASALPTPVSKIQGLRERSTLTLIFQTVPKTEKIDANAAEPYKPNYFTIIKKDSVEADAAEPYKPNYFSIIKKDNIDADTAEPYRPNYFTIIKKDAETEE